MADLLPVADAVRRILDGVAPKDPETVPLAAAAGRVLAAPLAARRTQPPFDASAMDGYAVRAADATEGARLRQVGESIAGKAFVGTLGPGETVRIFTGAPVPGGADAILIQEDADAAPDGTVTVREAVRPGLYVRTAGLDFRAGDELLPAGRRLGMREVALAAAMNHSAVPVRRRPLVALLATGDELVPPGTEPGPDQIVASNALGIAAYLPGIGADALDLGIVPDEMDATTAAIARAEAAGADVLVTLGGASVGERDLIREALAERGMALDFWRIAMRPGKPLLFGRLGTTRVIGMPGNPVSSLVCTLLFLRPLVAALAGEPIGDIDEAAILGTAVPENDRREDYVRASLVRQPAGLPLASPLGRQDSSMLGTLARADCLLIRPPHAPPAEAGEPCRIIRLP